jgi:hypothetical protein
MTAMWSPGSATARRELTKALFFCRKNALVLLPAKDPMSAAWKPGHFIKKAGDKIKDAKSSLAEDEPTPKADDDGTFEPVSMADKPPAAAAGGGGGGAPAAGEEPPVSFSELNEYGDLVASPAQLSTMDMFFGAEVRQRPHRTCSRVRKPHAGALRIGEQAREKVVWGGARALAQCDSRVWDAGERGS